MVHMCAYEWYVTPISDAELVATSHQVSLVWNHLWDIILIKVPP